MPARPVQIGVVGAGKWGRNLIRTLGEIDNISVCHVISQQEGLSLPADCEQSSNWKDLERNGNIQGIALAVPPQVQVEIATRFLALGIPLFLEKPLSLDVSSAKRLQTLATSLRVPVIVDHIYLFHPAYRALRSAVYNAGNIEKITSLSGSTGPFRKEFSPLWDWGPHDVALCLDLSGTMPSKIEARTLAHEDRSEGTGDVIQFDMEFPSGLRTRSTIGNLMPEKIRKLDVVVAQKCFSFNDLGDKKLLLRSCGRTSAIRCDTTSPLTVALTEFRDAIIENRFDITQLEIAVNVVCVLNKVEVALSN